MPQRRIQKWIERIYRHIQTVCSEEVNGGNNYKEGRISILARACGKDFAAKVNYLDVLIWALILSLPSLRPGISFLWVIMDLMTGKSSCLIRKLNERNRGFLL